MSTAHGLFIPPSCDILSFLGSLATLVFEYTECIYCGTSKGSVEGVQTHMRDKGHCKVPEEEAEVHMAGTKVSDGEMRLPNGTIINSRSQGLAHYTRTRSSRNSVHRNEQRAITADAEARQDPHETRIAIRGEMGLVGLTTEQRRALMATEKKMKTKEVIAEKKGRQRMVQAPVLTKYYKVCCVLSIERKDVKLMKCRLRILSIKLDDDKIGTRFGDMGWRLLEEGNLPASWVWCCSCDARR
jgi:pre-60S factor REI1